MEETPQSKNKKITNKQKLMSLIESSIECSRISLHAAIRNGSDVSENNFDLKSLKPNRKARIWFCPSAQTYIFEQKGVYFATPATNVIDAKPIMD